MKIIGLMSGTSLDAIDAALVEIARQNDTLLLKLCGFAMQPLDNTLREAVRAVLPPNPGSTRQVCELNVLLGEVFAQAAHAVAENAGVPLAEVDLIASHGQTVWHQPDGIRSTLQLGTPAVIAERTGCTVVSDFRPRDIAAGGQGAPLVPYFDALLWRHETKHRVLLNIGGIANLTYVPPDGEILAFDTGPGNMLMDEAMRILTNGEKLFDENGNLAREGTPHSELLGLWLSHPYFHLPPPKSTGRELFGPDMAHQCVENGHKRNLGDADIMASLAKFTARSITRAVRGFLPRCDELWISGGGALNRMVMHFLRQDFRTKLHRTGECGLPAVSKEAVAFAVLGYTALHGYPANVPSATGATHAVVLGGLTPGHNYRALLAQIAESPATAPTQLVVAP